MSAKKAKATFSWTSLKYGLNSKIEAKKIGEKISSPSFSSHLHEDIRWALVMYPKGFDQSSEDHVALFCQVLYDKQNSELIQDYTVKASISFSILQKLQDSYGRAYDQQFYNMNPVCHVFDKASSRIAGTKYFIQTLELKSIREKQFTISCEIDAELCVNSLLYSEIHSNNVENLCQDFEQLMKNHDFSDVTLVVSKKQIPAHKAILSARSSVFNALFKNDMKESKENVVNIQNAEFDTVMEMLRFIYTGKACNMDKLAFELLSLADQYALDDLKKECEYGLFKSMTVDNAISILSLADRHSAHNLRKEALNFIKSHM